MNLTNFLNSNQADLSYVNLLTEADLTSEGASYAWSGSNVQVSVASYGALGDGTDQTSAIQSAITANPNATIYFPEGIYVVSSPILIGSNTRLLGADVLQNTIIKAAPTLSPSLPLFAGSNAYSLSSPRQNIYIKKLIIDGNNNANREFALLFFCNTNGVYFIQSIIRNTSHTGLAVGGCQNIRVWGSKFENCGRETYSSSIGSTPALWSDTIAGFTASAAAVEKNLFLNNKWSAAYLGVNSGVFANNLCVGNKESAVYSGPNAVSISFLYNYITGQRKSNISASGIEIDGGNYLTIRNNIINDCGNDGISLQDSQWSIVEYNTCFNNGVENTVPAFNLASGITVYSNSTGTGNCTIRYNRCYDTANTQQIGLFLYKAPSATQINNSVITDNNNYDNEQDQVRNHQSNSIAGSTVFQNNISDPNSTSEGAPAISNFVQSVFDKAIKTYDMVASTSSAQRDSTVTYTISTTNIPNGLRYYLKENSPLAESEFQWLTNTVVISNNTASITRTVGPIAQSKTSFLQLREESFTGNIKANAVVSLFGAFTTGTRKLSANSFKTDTIPLSKFAPGAITQNKLANVTIPTIASVQLANSTFVANANATAQANNLTYLIITGNNFVNGVQVFAQRNAQGYATNSFAAASTTRVSSNTLNTTINILDPGRYSLFAVNPDSVAGFTPNVLNVSYGPATVEYLIVAGGGGGGYVNSGGGGAGGLRTGTTTIPIGTYSITIGAGGIGGAQPGGCTNGSNTSICGTGFSLSATGGGRGGSNGYTGTPSRSGAATGGSGGSGGGGGWWYSGAGNFDTAGAGNLGGYSPVEGYPGGWDNPPGDQAGGGGGGGASQAGSNAYVATAGLCHRGGNGCCLCISGTYQWYAGGGGGGARAGSFGCGGCGGGGAGGCNGATAGAAGTVNTGGGGGGGGTTDPPPSQGVGGCGGSGIVIISYPGVQRSSGGNVYTCNGKTVHVFTSLSNLCILSTAV
jgi:parallel beta-helix repeat protein